MVSTKILNKPTVINFDNKTIIFIQQQISILDLFLKKHVTLKTGVMMQLCHHWNKLNILKQLF